MTNDGAYQQMPSLDFGLFVFVRIIMTMCIKVDQLFSALNDFQWFHLDLM